RTIASTGSSPGPGCPHTELVHTPPQVSLSSARRVSNTRPSSSTTWHENARCSGVCAVWMVALSAEPIGRPSSSRRTTSSGDAVIPPPYVRASPARRGGAAAPRSRSPPSPARDSAGQVAGDHQALDLVGALEDLRDLGLPHVALHRALAGVAHAAERLHRVRGPLLRVGGHREGGVGGGELGYRGVARVRAASVLAARGVEIGGARGGQRRRHVGQQEAQTLVPDDRLAERLTLVRVRHRVLEGAL